MKKCRVLLVSDMHYTTDLSYEEMKAVFPEARASAAAGTAFGMTQSEKVQKVLEGIREENAKEPLDLVLVLGDLSIDDFDARHLPENYCEKFRDECMKNSPCDTYAIPGNHDSYPEEDWKTMFGYNRQFAIEKNGYLFVMLDTFRKYPAKDASGSGYTPVDTDWLKKVLDAHPQMPTFLCSHYFWIAQESEEFRRIVREYDQIVCLFHGHTHHDGVFPLNEEYGNKTLIDIGGYGYSMITKDGKFSFQHFDPSWAWGYEMLEIEEGKATLFHRKPEITYHAENGLFIMPDTVSGAVSFLLK